MAVWPDYKPALPGLNVPRSAQVAQLVEHATENRSVGGSIPPLGTISLSTWFATALHGDRKTYTNQQVRLFTVHHRDL
jgi:hypothetical protein